MNFFPYLVYLRTLGLQRAGPETAESWHGPRATAIAGATALQSEPPDRALVAAWLFAIGLYGIVTSRNFIHLISCLSVVQSSTYVILLSIGYRTGAAAPIFDTIKSDDTGRGSCCRRAHAHRRGRGRPTVTALLLALAMQLHKHAHTLDPHDLRTRPQRD